MRLPLDTNIIVDILSKREGCAESLRVFEDAVQASCAARVKADFIVTRNLRDFAHSPVAAVSPEAVLERV